MKINISEDAQKELKRVLDKKKLPNHSLRIFRQSIGWGGPVLSMSLDESKDEDISIEEEGFKFLIDGRLSINISKINIDYSNGWFRKGFRITSEGEFGGC